MSKLQFLAQVLLISSSAVFSTAHAAAKLGISPVQLDISPAEKTAIITLLYKGDNTVNLQLQATSWDMDENGRFIESETGDFVFYPRTLTLAGQENAQIRVGYMGDFPDKEKPFRVSIQELPPIVQPSQESEQIKAGVTALLNLSVPLYVVPVSNIPPVQIELDGLKTEENALHVGVKNLTAYHVNVRKVAVTLLKQGKVLAEATADIKLQRILGERRVFFSLSLEVEKLCQQADSLSLTVEADRLKDGYQTQAALKPGCLL